MLTTNTTPNSLETAGLASPYQGASPYEPRSPYPGATASLGSSDYLSSPSVLRAAFQYAPTGMALVAPDGRFLQVNRSLCEIVGYDEQDLLATTFQRIIYPDDLPTGLGYTQELLCGAIDHYTVEQRYVHKQGHIVWVLMTATLHRDLDGQPLYFVCQIVDISDRVRLQEERSAREEAERASKAKSEFLSRMSHELRTPMNAMLGFAQLLEMDDLTAVQRESTGHILGAGRHLLNLINEVLDIARIEEGHLSLSVEPVPLRAVLDETVQLMQPLAAQQDVTLKAEIKWLGDRHLKADRHRLQQVLLNLLSNAIKYNRKGAIVRVSCKVVETHCNASLPSWQIRISVSDCGPGISTDMLPRLFTPFERLGLDDRTVEGTGLGLALSKRLMEAMGGVIGVDSQVGKGSTFWIELPLVESQVQRFERLGTPPVASTASGDSTPRRTVLYIEDNLSKIG
jgi:PAS domain S-box-containing protein